MKILQKPFAYMLLPLVKANYWLRRHYFLKDKWFFADLWMIKLGYCTYLDKWELGSLGTKK